MFTLEPLIQAAADRQIRLHAVMVVKDDELLGAHRFSDERFYNVYSVTKSFTATAIGMGIDEGLLSLSDRPVDVFADLLPDTADPRWEKVTLRNLLTMTTGHQGAYLMAADRKFLRGETADKVDDAVRKEWLLYVFSRPMEIEPGTEFHYGNLGPYVAGRMLERAAGASLRDYLYERLWRPMGTKLPQWETDVSGHTFPASGLYLDIEDMTKFGLFCLHGERYDGMQLVSGEWIELAASRQVDCHPISRNPAAEDEKSGYGFSFWMNSRDGYRAYGRESQFVLVLPKKNAVVSIQADHSNVQQVMDLFWEYIYEQM